MADAETIPQLFDRYKKERAKRWGAGKEEESDAEHGALFLLDERAGRELEIAIKALNDSRLLAHDLSFVRTGLGRNGGLSIVLGHPVDRKNGEFIACHWEPNVSPDRIMDAMRPHIPWQKSVRATVSVSYRPPRR